MRAAVNIGRAAAPRTYAEFVTHVAALAVDGSRSWHGGYPAGTAPGKWQTQAASGSIPATLYGSSWGPATANGFLQQSGSIARSVQHGLASQSEFDAQVSAGGVLYIETALVGSGRTLVSVNRNGYTSLSDLTPAYTTSKIVLLLRWDFVAGQALQSNPSTGSSPTPYSW